MKGIPESAISDSDAINLRLTERLVADSADPAPISLQKLPDDNFTTKHTTGGDSEFLHSNFLRE